MESPKEAPKRNWFRQHYIISTVLALVFLFAVGGATQSSTQISSPPQNAEPNDNDSLHATVSITISGISVTNQEGVDWQDCMVGVNGDNGWNFNNPPYKTHAAISISSGKTVIVPYEQITSDDGTRFDYSTHGVNSAVVLCNQSDPNSWRYWTGSTQ